MQILLANAKIMFDKADRKPISVPLFQSVANYSSLSRISIISAAVITCGSFGKCLRFPVTKKESFRKPTFNSLYDPFGSPYRGQKPQGRRGKPPSSVLGTATL